LRYEGYQTVCAANGAEAMAALESGSADLVLLDVVMPKVDGLAFLEATRRDPAGRWTDLPVILLTGVLDPHQIARARQLAVKEIMTKARFTVEGLLNTVRTHLPKAAQEPVPDPSLPAAKNAA
jgi:CheY-like chemotaxis protein